MQTSTNRTMYKVLIPVERKPGKTFWMRVGSAFPGKDPGTFNMYIDAMPVGAKAMFHVREMDEEDFQKRRRDDDGGHRVPDALPLRAAANDDLPF